MKILFISHEAYRSGAPLALLQELKVFQKLYKDIHPIVLLFEEGPISDEFRKICTVIVYNRWYMRMMRKMHLQSWLFRHKRVSCIYANTIVSVELALGLKKELNVPVIAHIHELNTSVHNHINSLEELKYVDYFVAVSNMVAQNLIVNYGVAKEKIVIQHPFSPWVDVGLRKWKSEKQICYNEDSFIVGSFNSGIWQKSPDLIAIIVYAFFKKYPQANCHFINVGMDSGGSTCKRIQHDLCKIGLDDKVTFMDSVDKPLECHLLFDIYMLLSREDSFPLVAEESAVLGNPIVAFEGATGATEWIRKGAGIIVPYLDTDALADAIYILYEDKKLRERMGVQANAIIKSMYEQESKMDNIVRIIRSLGK